MCAPCYTETVGNNSKQYVVHVCGTCLYVVGHVDEESGESDVENGKEETSRRVCWSEGGGTGACMASME